ncbi:MAG: AzlD domain-containing protein [Oscillospiraceae bacterium]
MKTGYLLLAIAIMAAVTYLIRMLPLVALKKKINNNFVKSFLHYIPYGVLAAMTFPAILYSTQGIYSAVAGLIVALILAYNGKSLITVALSSCLSVLAVEFIVSLL